MVIKRIRERFARIAAEREQRRASAEAERELNEATARADRQALETARTAYREFLAALDWRTASESDLRQLGTLRARARLDARADDLSLTTAFLRIVNSALEDASLDEAEERQLLNTATALGFPEQRISQEFPQIDDDLAIARINAGRIPILSPSRSSVILRPGEQLHAITNAALLKEQAVREWRGGHSGVSFRVAKGVRFYLGGSRGRMETVGTRVVVADSGQFCVTSRRSVFAGRSRSLQFDHTKLTSMEVFTDGLLLGVSNRQTPSLFQFTGTSGPVLAAVINAAIQNQENAPRRSSRRSVHVERPSAALPGPETEA